MIRCIAAGDIHLVKYGTNYPGTSFEVHTPCGGKFQLLETAEAGGSLTRATWTYEEATCSECLRLSRKRKKRDKKGTTDDSASEESGADVG
jgi:hypothetical protein